MCDRSAAKSDQHDAGGPFGGALASAGHEQVAGSAVEWRYSPGEHPPAMLVRWARAEAGLTQAQAAALVYRSAPSRWAEWEAGTHRMDAAVFELFCRKTGVWALLVDDSSGQ